jgi:hypothetical protein
MKLRDIEPASSADYLLTAEGLPETYFESCTSPEKEFERAMFRDGFSAQEQTAATGSTKFTDLTIAKSFDPEQDAALIKWIEGLEGGKYASFTLRPVRRNLEVQFRGDKAFRPSRCRLKKATYPKFDVNAPTDVSMITLVFSVSVFAYS